MTKIAFIVTCMLFSTTMAARCHYRGPGGCQAGWINFGESCYYVYDYPLYTFDDAERVCNGMGASLVIINDADENLFLKAFTRHQRHIWIGVTDVEVEGVWVWVDGSPLTYSNWMPGEPNNAGKREHCAHLYSNQHGKWNDYPCSTRFGFICEKAAAQ
ncbi:perlucin-like protein [Ptychodera flava]|uniref:perlucin-like protein n=1 Tax=Ptychodera flava TaxID=63121 RepID=UPI00396A42AA